MNDTSFDLAARSRIKRAELLSTLGAAVLGGGIALALQRWLVNLVLPMLVIGVAVHAIGMFDKHRTETAGNFRRAAWENTLYWVCWATLGALVLYIVVVSTR
jgi:hypothetical protein